MVDRFNFVAFWIAQECSVVLRMIISQSRRTVVSSSGRNPGGVERVNLLDGRSPEAPMTAGIGRCVRGLIDAEVRMVVVIRLVPFPKTDGIVPLEGDDRSESGHDTEVERFNALQALNGDRDVIKELHGAYTGAWQLLCTPHHTKHRRSESVCLCI